MVRFTPAAYSELAQRISMHGDEPFASVLWSSAQIDLVRSTDGMAQWKEESPAQWHVSVRSRRYDELEPFDTDESLEEHFRWLNEQLISVGDLKVYFDPSTSGLTDVVVSFKDGQFNVQAADA